MLTESVSTRCVDDIELREGFYVSSIGFVFFFFLVSFLITVRPPAIHIYREKSEDVCQQEDNIIPQMRQ